MEPNKTTLNFHKFLQKHSPLTKILPVEDQIPYPRFRNYICEGMGRTED